MKIFIDAGHGGNSVGASYRGRKEQDDTLRLCLAVAEKLKKVRGTEVMLSRTGNTNPTITSRCAAANSWGADYFISVHRNAFAPEKADGVEAWVKSNVATGGNTYNYAKKIVDAIAAATGMRNRGIRKGAPAYADFGVNRLTEMHSCLLEAGFVDNSGDNRLFDEKFDEMATALATALCEIVGAEYPAQKPGKLKGDADGDGKVTVEDARAVLRAAVGLEKAADEKVCDTDGDGKITVNDARNTLRAALGLD